MSNPAVLDRLPGVNRAAVVVLMALVGIAMALSIVMRPVMVSSSQAEVSLEDALPRSFGPWREEKSPLVPVSMVVEDDKSESQSKTYDQSVMRTYVDSSGARVMLAVAYIGRQAQEGKIHRPELCYVAQGFNVDSLIPVEIPVSAAGRSVNVGAKRMLAVENGREELVSYWIRVGNIFTESPWQTRGLILSEGLKGRTVDGILVRVSQIVTPGTSEAERIKTYQLQERFLASLAAAIPSDAQRLFIGS